MKLWTCIQIGLVVTGLMWARDHGYLGSSAAAPVRADGLRVLIVEETANRGLYPKTKRDVLQTTAPGSFRDYAAKHGAPGPDGKTPDVNYLDDDDSIDQMPAWWAPVWEQRPREEEGQATGQLPWLVISNGRTGYVGPLPEESEAIALIQKYGGD